MPGAAGRNGFFSKSITERSWGCERILEGPYCGLDFVMWKPNNWRHTYLQANTDNNAKEVVGSTKRVVKDWGGQGGNWWEDSASLGQEWHHQLKGEEAGLLNGLARIFRAGIWRLQKRGHENFLKNVQLSHLAFSAWLERKFGQWWSKGWTGLGQLLQRKHAKKEKVHWR